MLQKKKNTTACVIIIGNEILSGRTIDTNKNYLCKELTSNGIDVIEARVIKDNEKQIIELFNFTKNKWGKLDVLINNAGIEDGYLIKDQTYEKFKETIKINMDASFLTSKNCIS